MPDEGFSDQVNRAQPRNKKKRGPTLCKNQPDGKEFDIEWDEYWRPVGKNAGKYANWVGLEARQQVDILYDSWDMVDDDKRDELWESVKVIYILINFFNIVIVLREIYNYYNFLL